MDRAWVLFAIVPLLAGCLGGSPRVATPTTTTDPLDRFLGAPDTVDGILNRTRHSIVDGQATLELEFRAPTNTPVAFSSLVYLAKPVSVGTVRMSGDPNLIAMVPQKALKTVEECGPTPDANRFYWRPRHGNTADANLTGRYATGWYHFVVISASSGTVALTFNSTKEVKARPFATGNPYVNATYVAVTQGREPSATAEIPKGAWFAWASHRVNQPGVDGGREQSVSIGGDCRKRTLTSSQTDLAFTSTQRLHVDGAGLRPTLDVRGAYRPNVGAAAPEQTTLEAAWVWFDDPVVPKPAT